MNENFPLQNLEARNEEIKEREIRKEDESSIERGDSFSLNLDALNKQGSLIEDREKGRDKKTLKKIRNIVGTLMISGLSLLPLGCKGDGNPNLETEREKIENLENTEDKNENNKKLLRDIFFSISNQGNSMGKSEEGNLIIDIGGGNFYELTSNDLQELMDLVGRHNTTNLSKRKDTIKIIVVDSIKKIGEKRNYIELPEDLRIKEIERRESINQMNNNSIIQPY